MSRISNTSARRGEGIPSAGASRRARFVLPLFILLGCSALHAEATYHVLQKGETLFSVSRQYNVPVDAIMAANGITDPSRLQAGQRLVIPSLHKVQKGETLYGIARTSGVSVERLRSANRLGATSLLRIGDVLYIPGSPSSAAVATATTPRPVAVDPGTAVDAGAPVDKAGGAAGGSSGSAGPPAAFDPPAVKVSDRAVDMKLSWPCSGEASYLDGKLFGVMFRPRRGDMERAVASGTVVSAGPYRGFGQVVFIQGRSGLIYVYGGNESIAVRVGDRIGAGQELGRVGVDAKEGRPTPAAYFFVFKNGEALDPASAPRD